METKLSTLAQDQLIRLIQKGYRVADCEAEWHRRWGQPYPWVKTMNGWRKEDES